MSELNRCPLTATVNKVSVGALELMEINCVKEPFSFLKECEKENWRIFSTGEIKQKNKNIDYKKISLQPLVLLFFFMNFNRK